MGKVTSDGATGALASLRGGGTGTSFKDLANLNEGEWRWDGQPLQHREAKECWSGHPAFRRLSTCPNVSTPRPYHQGLLVPLGK